MRVCVCVEVGNRRLVKIYGMYNNNRKKLDVYLYIKQMVDTRKTTDVSRNGENCWRSQEPLKFTKRWAAQNFTPKKHI